MEARYLLYCEEYIARHEPDKTVEEIMAEFTKVLRWHKRFNKSLPDKSPLLMPQKAADTLERRKVFINWYVQHERNKGRRLADIVTDLTALVFASETTIYNVLYNYQ
jgi:hypothetical protein